METVFDYSAGVIPVYLGSNEPLFLLMMQNNGYWSFPKGHPEEGETMQETACRELTEEAGITEYHLLPLPPTPIHYGFQRGDVNYQKTVTLYAATVPHKDVTIQAKEIQDYAWLTYKEACKTFQRSSFITALTAVKKYLDSLQRS